MKVRTSMQSDLHFVCGTGPAFQAIGGKCRAIILWELNARTRRFGELRRRIPAITEKMLVQPLREMVDGGLVLRVPHAVVPPHVDYSLTPLGDSLNIALGPIAEWGNAISRNPHRPGQAPCSASRQTEFQ